MERESVMENGSVLVLNADFIETRDEYLIFAELPGVKKEMVDVKMTNEGIQICGECDCDKKYAEMETRVIRRELLHAKACRYIAFSIPVLPEKAEARLENGLLEIKAPKASPGIVPERTRRRPLKPPVRIQVL